MWIATAFFVFTALAWLPLNEAYPVFAKRVTPERFITLVATCLVIYLWRKRSSVSATSPESASAPLVRLHILEGKAREFVERAAAVTRLGNETVEAAKRARPFNASPHILTDYRVKYGYFADRYNDLASQITFDGQDPWATPELDANQHHPFPSGAENFENDAERHEFHKFCIRKWNIEEAIRRRKAAFEAERERLSSLLTGSANPR
jgi:hypothetical protein